MKYKVIAELKETPKAYFLLVETGDEKRQVWLPKSKVTIEGGYVSVPDWLESKVDGTAEPIKPMEQKDAHLEQLVQIKLLLERILINITESKL